MSRSHVEVLCGSKVYEELYTVMQRHQWKPDSISKVENHDVYFIEFCDYRWCNVYKDVQEFMAVFDNCDSFSCDPDYFYSFIRLGEESEDVEIMQNHNYDYPYQDHYVYTAIERPLLEPIDELI
jgi:hypothetical protein